MPDADPSLNEQELEQQYVTMLYSRLDDLRKYAQTRLSTVLLETGGTPQARSERESFNAMYTEDLAKYDAAENGMCFGRIDFDDERRYVGRLEFWTPTMTTKRYCSTGELRWHDRSIWRRPRHLRASSDDAISAVGAEQSPESTTNTWTSTLPEPPAW